MREWAGTVAASITLASGKDPAKLTIAFTLNYPMILAASFLKLLSIPVTPTTPQVTAAPSAVSSRRLPQLVGVGMYTYFSKYIYIYICMYVNVYVYIYMYSCPS